MTFATGEKSKETFTFSRSESRTPYSISTEILSLWDGWFPKTRADAACFIRTEFHHNKLPSLLETISGEKPEFIQTDEKKMYYCSSMQYIVSL